MKTNLIKPILAITLLVLMLSACATPTPEPQLEGTTWELVSMGDQLPVPGTTITITFDEGQLGGNSGCNSYGGAYEVEGDSFKPGELFSTMMYCEAEGVMDQEAAYLKFLSQVRSFSFIDGGLYMSQPDGSQLEFIPQQ